MLLQRHSVNNKHRNIHVVNYTVIVKLYRRVALISHLPITLCVVMVPLQQLLLLLNTYQT